MAEARQVHGGCLNQFRVSLKGGQGKSHEQRRKNRLSAKSHCETPLLEECAVAGNPLQQICEKERKTCKIDPNARVTEKGAIREHF
jgi:hypothetical protein